MGYVKEPKGVDFSVINREMTKDEKEKLSEFIAKRKKVISRIRTKKQSKQHTIQQKTTK